LFEIVEIVVTGKSGKLILEALQIPECKVVDNAHQTIQFHQRVLKRSSGKENFGRMAQRGFYRVAYLVRGFVNIPEPMSLIDNDKVPLNLLQVDILGSCKMI
jgi:hypothetical protein